LNGEYTDSTGCLLLYQSSGEITVNEIKRLCDATKRFHDTVTQHMPLIDSSTRWRLESEGLHIRNYDRASSYEMTLDIKQAGETQHQPVSWNHCAT
jgi:hypothetical protein